MCRQRGQRTGLCAGGAPSKWSFCLTDARRGFGRESACKKGKTEKEAEHRMLKGKILKML